MNGRDGRGEKGEGEDDLFSVDDRNAGLDPAKCPHKEESVGHPVSVRSRHLRRDETELLKLVFAVAT